MTPEQRELTIDAWVNGGSRVNGGSTEKIIAATLARELIALPPGTTFSSSMKIAARFATSNSTAVRARALLLSKQFIVKTGRRYYVA